MSGAEMVQAAGRSPMGDPFLFLGITAENVTRLVAGEPIVIPSDRMRELGLPPMVVGLHYGRTVEDVVAGLRARGMIAPGARITDETARG
jgi:hypothetical protein